MSEVTLPCRPRPIGPTDVPRVRDEMVRAVETGGLLKVLMQHRAAGRDVRLPTHRIDDDHAYSWSIDEYVAAVARWLRVADLYHVTAELTAVARQGAATFPPYRLRPDDIPSKVGLIIWDDPIYVANAETYHDAAPEGPDPVPLGTAVAVRAVLWAPCDPGLQGPDHTGVQLVMFADTDVLLAGERYTSEPDYERIMPVMRHWMGPLYYHDEVALPFADADAEMAGRPVGNTAVGGVFTTWLLMGQRVTATEPATMPRALRRQYARAGRPEPAVRVITLRRVQIAREHDGEQVPTREYHHRWWVQGFWREQWYPSLNQHRTIYIAQHIRGPEGAPMIRGERVYNLAR